MRNTMDNLQSKSARGNRLEKYTPHHHYPVHPTRQAGNHNNGNSNHHEPRFSRPTHRDDYSGLNRSKKQGNDEM